MQNYGALNVVADRRNSANLIEDHLTRIFKKVKEPIIYTGGEAVIAGRKPDWIVHLHKKVILYMGLRYHSEEQIKEEIKDYNNLGYDVYIIKSDEYSNNDMNGWKDNLIIDRVNLFVSSDLSIDKINTQIPLIKKSNINFQKDKRIINGDLNNY